MLRIEYKAGPGTRSYWFPIVALLNLASISVEEVQSVGGVVYVVDIVTDSYQSEQSTRSWRTPRAVEQILGDLLPVRRGLHHVPIVSVYCEDVTIGCHGET